MDHQRTVRSIYELTADALGDLEAATQEPRQGGVLKGGARRGRDLDRRISPQAVVAGQLLALVVGTVLRTLDIRELAKAAGVVARPDDDGRRGDGGWAERAMDRILVSLLGRSLFT